MAVVSLDSPQRSLSHRTFREGTPNGTAERLAEIQHLTAETTELLERSFPTSKLTLTARIS